MKWQTHFKPFFPLAPAQHPNGFALPTATQQSPHGYRSAPVLPLGRLPGSICAENGVNPATFFDPHGEPGITPRLPKFSRLWTQQTPHSKGISTGSRDSPSLLCPFSIGGVPIANTVCFKCQFQRWSLLVPRSRVLQIKWPAFHLHFIVFSRYGFSSSGCTARLVAAGRPPCSQRWLPAAIGNCLSATVQRQRTEVPPHSINRNIPGNYRSTGHAHDGSHIPRALINHKSRKNHLLQQQYGFEMNILNSALVMKSVYLFYQWIDYKAAASSLPLAPPYLTLMSKLHVTISIFACIRSKVDSAVSRP